MTMPEILTYMVSGVAIVAVLLMGLLTYQIYKTDMYRPDLNPKNNKDQNKQ